LLLSNVYKLGTFVSFIDSGSVSSGNTTFLIVPALTFLMMFPSLAI